MSEQVLIQFSVDNDLKNEVSEIYDAMGLDLTTAFKMFLMRSKLVRGLPFPTSLPETTITKSEGLEAFYEMRKQAADVPEMTLEEINNEISEVRKERRK